ncbi:hypothetical protein NDA13_006009 [Ustilago tritici]|nr:hypothetical protein NDA13_006009 [Ustilago tritici]
MIEHAYKEKEDLNVCALLGPPFGGGGPAAAAQELSQQLQAGGDTNDNDSSDQAGSSTMHQATDDPAHVSSPASGTSLSAKEPLSLGLHEKLDRLCNQIGSMVRDLPQPEYNLLKKDGAGVPLHELFAAMTANNSVREHCLQHSQPAPLLSIATPAPTSELVPASDPAPPSDPNIHDPANPDITSFPSQPQPWSRNVGPSPPSAAPVAGNLVNDNMAKVPTSKDAEPGVLVNGVRVMVPEPVAIASFSKAFLRLLPDVRSFAQAWTVYTTLRCTYTNDPHLSASLGAFLVHVIDLDITFHWPAVAEYVLAVCRRRFRFANASDWIEKDLDAWQEELGGAPQRSIHPNPSNAKTTTAPSQLSSGPKGPRPEAGIQVCFRFNNSGTTTLSVPGPTSVCAAKENTPSKTAPNLWPRRPPPNHG